MNRPATFGGSTMRWPDQSRGKDTDLLAYDVLGHLRDLAPLIFREVEAACHDLLPHVLRDGATVVLGVERRVAAQHHVDNHTERPQVTALKNNRKRKIFSYYS